MYGLHNKLTAKQGQGQDLADILLDAAKLVAHAKGCKLYLVSKDTTNTDCIWITETWDSKEDHDNSLKLDGVKELIGKAMPILAEPPTQGNVLEVLGGAGLNQNDL